MSCAILGSAASYLRANTITGDPSADGGWTAKLNSLASGAYADGTAMFSANMYTTAFTLDPSSPLISSLGGYDWQAGDVIVGVGGDFVSTTPAAGGWGAYTGGVGVNSNLTYSGGMDENNVSHTGSTSLRIVAKYAISASPPAWSTSTAAPDAGNGAAALAGGGNGAILLGNYPYDFYPADAGTLIVPADSPEEQTASGPIGITGDVGREITAWSGSSMVGFESFLDLSLLNRTYGASATPPAVALGNAVDLDLQRGTGAVTDALTTLPSSVPEPASAGLLAIFAVPLARRRRHQR
jgi:hypothetical protein